MGALAVKEKLAIGVQNFSDAPRIIAVAYLAADLQKENLAANDELVEGAYHDTETGLIYNGDNYYDPRTGRWIKPDGMSVAEHVERWRLGLVPGRPPLEINPYVRALNNPLRWIDSTGFEATVPSPSLPAPGTGTGVGSGIGSAIGRGIRMCLNPVVTAILATTYSTPTGGCGDDGKCSDTRDDKCDKQYYEVDIPTCRGISRSRGAAAAARCYASASERYAACLAGRPMPPLDTYNN